MGHLSPHRVSRLYKLWPVSLCSSGPRLGWNRWLGALFLMRKPKAQGRPAGIPWLRLSLVCKVGEVLDSAL